MSAARIPILNRRGAIRAYALVDDGRADELGTHRWSWSHGYAVRFDGDRRGVRMHRVVLGLRASSLDADHINGNTLDNRLVNLRAVSHRENTRNSRWHRERRPVHVPEPIIVRTLEEQVEAIRARRAAGERGIDLAAEFGISQQLVCDIVKGRKYADWDRWNRVPAAEQIGRARESGLEVVGR